MQEKQSFFDSKTVVAIVMTIGVLVGWQKYMDYRYGKPDHTEQAGQQTSPVPKQPVAATNAQALPTEPMAVTPQVNEEIISYKNSGMSFDLSSRGMAVKNVEILKITDREGEPMKILAAEGAQIGETYLEGVEGALNFSIRSTGENEFLGQASIAGQTVTKRITVAPESYKIEVEVTVRGPQGGYKGVGFRTRDIVEVQEQSSFMAPSYEYQGFYVSHGTETDREIFSKDEPLTQEFRNVGIVALDSLYFAQAIVDTEKSSVHPNYQLQWDTLSSVFTGNLYYPVQPGSSDMTVSQIIYLGPKKMNLLVAADQRMEDLIDFGFFGWIARPLLSLLKWLHGLFGNWGWAIIVLTLIVRLLVLPINIKSTKSMKAMQAIQPQMKAMREKFKDDPQVQQQEVMKLMRENKVNPLGGCLPMLLQIPVFFALYRVLGNSIELYQAPFLLWIHDLSIKDPYYVLPVLMGISMFFQQKLTPTAMDPAQQKVMMIMPVFFTLIMLSLPSGLNLYIFISTLFGIGQQYMLMRDKTPTQNVVEARA